MSQNRKPYQLATGRAPQTIAAVAARNLENGLPSPLSQTHRCIGWPVRNDGCVVAHKLLRIDISLDASIRQMAEKAK